MPGHNSRLSSKSISPTKCLDKDLQPVVDIFQVQVATLTNQYRQIFSDLDVERAVFRRAGEDERNESKQSIPNRKE